MLLYILLAFGSSGILVDVGRPFCIEKPPTHQMVGASITIVFISLSIKIA